MGIYLYIYLYNLYIMINQMMLVVSLLCSTIIRMKMTMANMFEVG